jgi:hypothetical protein
VADDAVVARLRKLHSRRFQNLVGLTVTDKRIADVVGGAGAIEVGDELIPVAQ